MYAAFFRCVTPCCLVGRQEHTSTLTTEAASASETLLPNYHNKSGHILNTVIFTGLQKLTTNFQSCHQAFASFIHRWRKNSSLSE